MGNSVCISSNQFLTNSCIRQDAAPRCVFFIKLIKKGCNNEMMKQENGELRLYLSIPKVKFKNNKNRVCHQKNLWNI